VQARPATVRSVPVTALPRRPSCRSRPSTPPDSSQSAANRSFDIEANKAASMGAFGRHMMDRGLLSPARVDAAMHAATVRAIGAAPAK
jgi:hypothetical protein